MKINSLYLALLFAFTSCGTAHKIKDGRTAYDFKKYALALDLFKKEFSKVTTPQAKTEIAMLIGDCHSKLNQYKDALEYFSKAENLAENKDAARLRKAYILKNMMQYEEAAQVFESLSSNINFTSEVNQQKLICRNLQTNRAPSNLTIEVFEPSLASSDYGTSFFEKDYLLISSDRSESKGSSDYEWTGRRYSDLYLMHKRTKKVIPFDESLNTVQNEGSAVLSNDAKTLIFSRCYSLTNEKDETCKLMVSKNIDGVWSEAQALSFQSSNIHYSHPCLITHDSVLIFTSKGEEESKGFDLWYAEWNGSTWTDPYPMPPSINTSANEFFPTADGDTLYFSSDNSRGYGGLDLYKTWLDAKGKWQTPMLLPYPINTGADDFAYVVDRSSDKAGIDQEGYFSSSRSMNGLDQIYYYKYLSLNSKKEAVPNPNLTPPKDITIYLALKVIENPWLAINETISKKKKSIHKAKVKLFNNGKIIDQFETDKNGLVLTTIKINTPYAIIVEKDSFLINNLEFNTHNLPISADDETFTVNKEVALDKIQRGKEIVLENIYYDYNKWDIKEESKPSLDRLVTMLQSNPTIMIELGSHTDCRGDDTYNIDLSAKRATSAQNYLITKGISSARLSSRGYGESNFAISCPCDTCTEDEHQANRRTTFKIL